MYVPCLSYWYTCYIQDILKSASSAVNEAAANSFVKVVQKELVPSHLYITSFFPSILKGIESRDVCKWMCVNECVYIPERFVQ